MQSSIKKLFESSKTPSFLLDESFEVHWFNKAADKNYFCRSGVIASFISKKTDNIQRLQAFGNISLSVYEELSFSKFLSISKIAFGYLAQEILVGAPEVISGCIGSSMRENLTDIFAALPMLERQLCSETGGEQYITHIAKNCYMLLRTTNNITTLARFSSPKPIVTTSIELCSLLKSICEGTETLCAHLNIPLKYDIQSTPVFIRGDKNLLTISILNLLLNSLYFTRDFNEISVRLISTGSGAIITIADKGMGIKPEVLPFVCQPYYSVAPHNEGDPAPGIGIGLTIVEESVRAMGGTFVLDSRFSQGTTAAISLPLDTTEQDGLASTTADYILNKFSPLYVQLSSVCRFPE